MSDELLQARTTLKGNAIDKKRGMTVDEIRRFLMEVGNCGLEGDTPVKVTTGWRQQITHLEVSG